MVDSLPIYVVDAFTNTPFAGNPAAVCLVTCQTPLSDKTMQKIAAEMNLSETAFIQRKNTTDTFVDSDHFGLRYFMPSAVEVPLCGHATLASAAVLFAVCANKSAKLTFDTLKGLVTAVKDGDYVRMDFPLNEPQPLQKSELADLTPMIKSLVGDKEIQDVQYSASTRKLLVRLSDSYTVDELSAMKANTSQMTSLHNTGKVRGVIVTVRAQSTTNGHYDFASRYFGPWVGINEDSVSGVAHTVAGTYWESVLGKSSLFARQCSPRGGDLRLRIRRHDNRVDVSGRYVIVLSGSLTYRHT